MPLQGVPHQRFEVGDARGKSHPHSFGLFIVPADRHGVLQGPIQRLPSVGSDIVEGGAHFGIGGRNFFTSIAADHSGGGAKENNSVLWIGSKE